MKSTVRINLKRVALCVALALGTAPALAQTTTSAVAGRITAEGKAVSGATVTIRHVESGSVNTVATDAEGRYQARGLRTGGPYTITVTKDGKTETRENVFLTLAETTAVDVAIGRCLPVRLLPACGDVGMRKERLDVIPFRQAHRPPGLFDRDRHLELGEHLHEGAHRRA